MSALTGLASLKAGLMIAAPVLAVATPLVLAALFLRPEGSSAHLARAASVHVRQTAVARPSTVMMPALASPVTQAANRKESTRAKASGHARSVAPRVPRPQSLALLTQVSSADGVGGCPTNGLLGLACGSAPAKRSSIQAQLSYNHLNSRCPGLIAAYGRGGLAGSLIYAMNSAQLSARRNGLSAHAEEAQVMRALQQALVVSGTAPRDVLSALADLQAVYGGCEGYDSARNALLNTASLIQSQLGFDRPTATAGFGAAFASPGLLAAGALGTASYSTQGGP